MQNDSEILESLKCPVCLDYAEEPMECQFCNHIFCKNCIIGSDQSKVKITLCPMCRKESNYKESAFAKRLLGNLPIACPNDCSTNISRNELKGHLTKCPNKNYSCNIVECNYQGKKLDFIQHIVSQHENDILNKFDKFSGQNTQKLYINTPSIQSSQLPLEKEINFNLLEIDDSNAINSNNSFKNSKGDLVSVGQTGIFYCTKRLGFNCGCCDGNCGPDNGCCCKACMDLNIHIRNLPKGNMVNKEGRVAKWTRCSYFCGVEYEKETKNIFKKIFKKKIICEYPNDSCQECHVLTRNIKFYLSIHEISNL
jgi:hypothetical protein